MAAHISAWWRSTTPASPAVIATTQPWRCAAAIALLMVPAALGSSLRHKRAYGR